MHSITIKVSDDDAAAIDARAAELTRATFVRVGRSHVVMAAVGAYLAGRPNGSGQRPLPPRTRTRAVA